MHECVCFFFFRLCMCTDPPYSAFDMHTTLYTCKVMFLWIQAPCSSNNSWSMYIHWSRMSQTNKLGTFWHFMWKCCIVVCYIALRVFFPSSSWLTNVQGLQNLLNRLETLLYKLWMHLCLPFLCEGAVLKKTVVGSLFEDWFPYLEVIEPTCCKDYAKPCRWDEGSAVLYNCVELRVIHKQCEWTTIALWSASTEHPQQARTWFRYTNCTQNTRLAHHYHMREQKSSIFDHEYRPHQVWLGQGLVTHTA